MVRQGRRFCFTSYKEDFELDELPRDARGVVYQTEICPQTGREHIQGYIEFKKNKRKRAVQEAVGDPVAHITNADGTSEHNRVYCTKEESRKPGTEPTLLGELSGEQGRRTDLEAAVGIIQSGGNLQQLAQEQPTTFVRNFRGLRELDFRLNRRREFRPINCQVFSGPAGTGKTRLATRVARSLELEYFILDKAGDTVWFDGYEGEAVLIIDDFYGWIPYNMLLRMTDVYRCRLPTKGGMTWANWNYVIITSNVSAALWYKSGCTPALQRRLTEEHDFLHPPQLEDLNLSLPELE